MKRADAGSGAGGSGVDPLKERYERAEAAAAARAARPNGKAPALPSRTAWREYEVPPLYSRAPGARVLGGDEKQLAAKEAAAKAQAEMQFPTIWVEDDGTTTTQLAPDLKVYGQSAPFERSGVPHAQRIEEDTRASLAQMAPAYLSLLEAGSAGAGGVAAPCDDTVACLQVLLATIDDDAM